MRRGSGFLNHLQSVPPRRAIDGLISGQPIGPLAAMRLVLGCGHGCRGHLVIGRGKLGRPQFEGQLVNGAVERKWNLVVVVVYPGAGIDPHVEGLIRYLQEGNRVCLLLRRCAFVRRKLALQSSYVQFMAASAALCREHLGWLGGSGSTLHLWPASFATSSSSEWQIPTASRQFLQMHSNEPPNLSHA